MKWLLLGMVLMLCVVGDARPAEARPGAFARFVMRIIDFGFRLFPDSHHEDEPSHIDCTPPPPSDKPLVLLIYGFYGRPTEFYHLKPALEQALRGRCDVAIVTPLDEAMGESPDDPARQIDAYLEQNGLRGRPLILVGHSTGGVVARRFLAWQPAPAVLGVVGLGAPNGGVRKFDLVPVHWLRAHGFDARVNVPYPARADVPFLMVVGTGGHDILETAPNDGVVSKASVEALHGPNITCTTHSLNHWQLLRDPAVTAEIITFINGVLTPAASPPPAPPTPRPSDAAP